MRTVFNQKGNRCTGGFSIKHARENLHFVLFAALSGNTVQPLAQLHLRGNKTFIHRNTGGKTIQHGTDCAAVAFTEKGDIDTVSKAVFH